MAHYARLTLLILVGTGDHHRRQRKLLNPVFSIAHMRNITPTFYEVMNRVSPFVFLGLVTYESRRLLRSFKEAFKNSLKHPKTTKSTYWTGWAVQL